MTTETTVLFIIYVSLEYFEKWKIKIEVTRD